MSERARAATGATDEAARLRCPVCSARFRGAAVCGRCAADLGDLHRTFAAAWRARRDGWRRLLRGDATAAAAAARRSLGLAVSPSARRLAWLADLLGALPAPGRASALQRVDDLLAEARALFDPANDPGYENILAIQRQLGSSAPLGSEREKTAQEQRLELDRILLGIEERCERDALEHVWRQLSPFERELAVERDPERFGRF
ncbi:MAG: hypothetical protein IPM29_26610 [Planctomycetes bacterium]|nr:hypothetical protein [Planctomycetota bacterium]